MIISRSSLRDAAKELIGLTLKNIGVRRIYTICGGHISPIIHACNDVGIAVISGRHEQNLAYAASAEAVLTNVPGTVVVTAGPGLAYIFGAIKTAYFKRLPLVVLAGATATVLMGRGSLQDSDQMGDMAKYTKCQIRFTRVRDIPEKLTQLYVESMSDIPGPVYGEFPMDIDYPSEKVNEWYRGKTKTDTPFGPRARTLLKSLKIRKLIYEALLRYQISTKLKTIQELPAEIYIPDKLSVPSKRLPAKGKIYSSVKLINSSKRPVLLIGGQIAWSSRKNEINSIIEKLSIPVYVNDLARGIIKYNNPFLLNRSRGYALSNADLVILAGIPPDFRINYGKWGGGINRKAKVIRIDLDTNYLRKNTIPDIEIQSEPGETLFYILQNMKYEIRDTKYEIRDTKYEIRDTKYGMWSDWERWHEELKNIETAKGENDMKLMLEEENGYTTPMVHQIRLGKELEKFLSTRSKKKIVIGDGGDFAAIVSRELKSYDVWLDAGPFGSLGTGVGFSMAAGLCCPDAEVYTIFGDGAFGYSLIDLDTMESLNIGFVGIIGNNSSWAQIKRSDEEIYKKSIATDLKFRRYDKLVESLGCSGYYIEEKGELEKIFREASKEAFERNKPVVINVKVGPTNARAGSLAV